MSQVPPPKIIPGTAPPPRERWPLLTYFREFKPSRGKLLLALTLAAIKHSPVLIIPIYTAWVLDHVVPQGDINGLLLCLVGMISLIVMNVCTHPLYAHLYSQMRRDAALRLRSRLCMRIQQLVFAWHDSSHSGRLHSKVMQDVEKLDQLAGVLVDALFIPLITAITAVAIVAITEPRFLVVIAIFLPIVLLQNYLLKKQIEERFKRLRIEQEKLNAEVNEMIVMLPLSRAHATETEDLRRVGSRLDQVREVGIKTDWTSNLLGSQMWGTSQLIGIAVVIFGGWMVMQGMATVGQIVMYMSFVGMTIGSMSAILAMLPNFFGAAEAMRSINEVLNYPAIEQNAGKPDLPLLQGEIVFDDVTFSYPGNARPVLKHLNTRVEPNQVIALVGGSGAGKTTFVKLLLGLYTPESGDIRVDGQSLNNFNLRSLRKQVGIVTQDTFLFNGTILQNLTHGLEGIDITEVEAAARQAHAHEFISTLEKGYETEIGDRGLKLSGGQKQRLAIARALLRKPRLLLLDEATSALDSQSERIVQEALETLVKGRTTFVIAHRLSTIRNADRILVFDDGAIVEDGTHEALLRNGGLYAKLVALQHIA